MPCLVHLIASDKFRGDFMKSRLQKTCTELDTGSVGAKSNIWLELAKAFIDPKAKVFATTALDTLRAIVLACVLFVTTKVVVPC